MTTKNGVNFGGWFIPEKWMNPGVFEGLAAHDFWTLVSSEEGLKRYRIHVREFIVEKDFQCLQDNGVSVIRLPVAWWMTEEKYQFCRERLDWAVRMAEKYQLQLLFDYHGARGSQNGKDHSGKSGEVRWKDYFHENTVKLLELVETYSASPAIWGVELLNEPMVRGHYFSLVRFYRMSERILDKKLPSDVHIVIHDGFLPLLFIGVLCSRRKRYIDMHLYEIPLRSDDTLAKYLNRRDKVYRRKIRIVQWFQPVIIGEWSGVLPYVFFKNKTPVETQKIVQQNIKRQQQLYSIVDATFFWNYLAHDSVSWSARTYLD